MSGISSSPPNTALLTNRKSPMRSVFSMLAEGMRNASTRNDRSTIQISRAVPIALSHAIASSFAVFGGGFGGLVEVRSEEHTSELQSQSNLVCRLLLEKKKAS